MDNFFSIVGTIASIGSVPLSIYLYLKSKEGNIDRVKREIVRILSHQMGDNRELTNFEIQTVINSKTREYKISPGKITVDHIIEDLVSETILNPLLDKALKEKIIGELRKIYYKGEILQAIEEMMSQKYDGNTEDKIEKQIKDLVDKGKEIENESKHLEEIDKESKFRSSDYFGLISGITTLIVATLISFGKERYEAVSKPVYNFLANNDFYIGLIASVLTALVTSIGYFFIRKAKSK